MLRTEKKDKSIVIRSQAYLESWLVGRILRQCVFLYLLVTGMAVVAYFNPVCAATAPKADMVVAYSPYTLTDVDPKDAISAFNIYVHEVATLTGYSGATYPYDNLDAVMKEVDKGRVDMVVMNSIDYMRLKNRSLVELAYGSMRGGKVTFKYLILTRRNKGYTKLGDLRGKKIDVVKGNDLSMFVLSTALLKQKLGQPQNFFSQIEMKSKVSQAVLSVFFGQADACVVNDVSYMTMVEMNPQLARDLKPIYYSAELVDMMTVFRKSLGEDIKQKTLEVSKKLKTHARGKQLLMLFKIDEIVPIKEADLLSVRELIHEHDLFKARR